MRIQTIYKNLTWATLSLLCICSSCGKGFLNTTPTAQLTSKNFWKSSVDALAGLNACYATLTNQYLFGNWGMPMFETLTPNANDRGSGEAYGFYQIAEDVHNSSNTSIINNRWGADFQGIGQANAVLANVPSINMDTALRSRILGEAYFLRALYYQDLVNYYGAVPLMTTPPSLSQGSQPRSTQDSLLAQIYSDLDIAVMKLPVSYGAADLGRATKGAALALKGRVYLYQGQWALAAACEKAVMSLNAYSLFPNYRTMLQPANDNNAEVIFDVQFSLPNNANSFDVNLDRYTNSTPVLDLIDAYLCSDGLPTSQSPLYNPARPYDNRDPRLQQTVALPGYMYKGAIVTNSTYTNGAAFKKYTIYQDNVVPSAILSDGQSYSYYQVIRYAEVLLSYAEAQNESVGPDATVYAALDAVRARAGMPKVSVVNPGLSQAAMRSLIQLERRIEFAGEGLYYADIRRWRIAEVVMKQPAMDVFGNLLQNRNFTPDRDYIWPIPSVQIQQNPNLTQNPNY